MISPSTATFSPGRTRIIFPDDDYLNQIRKICDANNWLMILDEIQTGIGRTGKLYAHQHNAIVPDVLTSAKALGNGIPIGACMARGKAAELIQFGKHGSTFGGNPFACHVARAVIKTVMQDNISDNAAAMGDYLIKQFNDVLTNVAGVREIRGKGLMIGIELDRPAREIYQLALSNKVLFSVTAEKVIRVVPPLIITQAEADIIVERISTCIKTFLKT